jgi:solute carrier family 25 2-oxodicarboxylate transporter 21
MAEKPLPMQYSLLAGAIAGITEILAMYPVYYLMQLDTVKTRFQIQVGNSEYKSILDCFRKMVQKEGLGSLYRGILPPILVEAPKRAIKFGANDKYTQIYTQQFGFTPSKSLSVLTGVSAGCTEALIVALPDLVKIRMQDKANAGKYAGPADVVAKIVKHEGFTSLFRGLEATIWRHAVWNGGYFGSISYIKSLVPKAETKEGKLASNFLCGSIGGTIGTLLNTPFDVAKSRIQSETVLPYKYSSTLPSVYKIASEEGFGALYKGFAPKVLRLGPGGGILLVVFEFVSGYIRKNVKLE